MDVESSRIQLPQPQILLLITVINEDTRLVFFFKPGSLDAFFPAPGPKPVPPGSPV